MKRERPEIRKEHVKPLFESRFIKVFDLQYAPGKHYYDATRRSLEDLAAVKTDEEFQRMLPDAVSCIVILEIPENEPRLLLSQEFRYPAGQFLLSPPAGLLDERDAQEEDPILAAALRELREETGLTLGAKDTLSVVNPLLFSTPGMTDESNALVCAVIHLEDLSSLTQSGAVGAECFDGFTLLTQEQARQILKDGRDENGSFYSVYTWAALIYFVSGLWN